MGAGQDRIEAPGTAVGLATDCATGPRIVLCVLSSFAIISLRKRESRLCSCFNVKFCIFVCILISQPHGALGWLVIKVFSDPTYLFFLAN